MSEQKEKEINCPACRKPVAKPADSKSMSTDFKCPACGVEWSEMLF